MRCTQKAISIFFILAVISGKSLYPDVIDITNQSGFEQEQLTNIVSCSTNHHFAAVVYKNGQGRLFRISSENMFQDISNQFPITLAGLASFVFLSNQLIALCYKNYNTPMEFFFFNQDQDALEFINISNTSKIPLKNLDHVSFITSGVFYDALLVFIFYANAIGSEAMKIFTFDSETSTFSPYPISFSLDDEVPFSINIHKNRFIVALPNKKIKTFIFDHQNKTFIENNNSMSCITDTHLKGVKSIGTFNDHIIFLYYQHNNYCKVNQPIRALQSYCYTPDNYDLYTLSHLSVDSNNLGHVVGIQFIEATQGTIVLINLLDKSLKIFWDENLPFTQRSKIKKTEQYERTENNDQEDHNTGNRTNIHSSHHPCCDVI